MSGMTASCFIHGDFDASLRSCPTCKVDNAVRAARVDAAVSGGRVAHDQAETWPDETQARLSDAVSEEIELMSLVSYHRVKADGDWYADLTPGDIGTIRALLATLAEDRAVLVARVQQLEDALEAAECVTWSFGTCVTHEMQLRSWCPVCAARGNAALAGGAS